LLQKTLLLKISVIAIAFIGDADLFF